MTSLEFSNTPVLWRENSNLLVWIIIRDHQSISSPIAKATSTLFLNLENCELCVSKLIDNRCSFSTFHHFLSSEFRRAKTFVNCHFQNLILSHACQTHIHFIRFYSAYGLNNVIYELISGCIKS